MGVKHLAVAINSDSEKYEQMFENVKAIVDSQVQKDIRILTIGMNNIEIDSLIEFFKFYLKKERLNKERIKVSIIGKWYDLPSRVLDVIKEVMDETREYDHYFLNFTINYDGREEIVDACKLLCRKVLAEKIDIDRIDTNVFKEDLYSSYFLPPEIIIITGKEQKTKGFMLWDSVDSKIIFTGKDFLELDLKEFEKIIS